MSYVCNMVSLCLNDYQFKGTKSESWLDCPFKLEKNAFNPMTLFKKKKFWVNLSKHLEFYIAFYSNKSLFSW